jgi:hypothetical protein
MPVPLTVDETVRKFQFLRYDAVENCLIVESGEWAVHEDFLVPFGVKLIISSGTTLRFSRNSILLSFSPIRFEGSLNKPVELTSLDDHWGGLFVIEAKGESLLDHVFIRNTRGIGPHLNLEGLQRDGWFQSGGVTFYKSPLQCRNSSFISSKAEDMLNIFNAKFMIDNCKFIDSFSDGFDGDFVSGTVINCEFSDIKGDAIDVSGSTLTISKSEFNRIGDKAISAGEGSDVSIRSVDIRGVAIGVASKDASSVEVIDSFISNANVFGLTAFNKKPGYGKAELTAISLAMENVVKPVFVEGQSQVLLNGNIVDGSEYDIKALYETGFLGN